MKKIFTFLTVMLITVASWAQTSDYLLKKDFQSEKKKITDGIDAAKKAGFDAKKLATKQMTAFDSLAALISANEKNLKSNNDSLQKVAARFNDLDLRISKSSSNTGNLLLLAVIVIAILFLLFLALIFFMRSKADEKIHDLSEEITKLDESVKEDVASIREEVKKSNDSLSSNLKQFSDKFTAAIDRSEEKQRNLAAELEELVNKTVKEHALQLSKIDEKFNELSSKLNTEGKDHKTFHDKLETDFKGLRSLLSKEIEEIKAKL
jgi:predicted PurR-regulated permease PerM